MVHVFKRTVLGQIDRKVTRDFSSERLSDVQTGSVAYFA